MFLAHAPRLTKFVDFQQQFWMSKMKGFTNVSELDQYFLLHLIQQLLPVLNALTFQNFGCFSRVAKRDILQTSKNCRLVNPASNWPGGGNRGGGGKVQFPDTN